LVIEGNRARPTGTVRPADEDADARLQASERKSRPEVAIHLDDHDRRRKS